MEKLVPHPSSKLAREIPGCAVLKKTNKTRFNAKKEM